MILLNDSRDSLGDFFLLLFSWLELQRAVIFFFSLPHSETWYIGPFFFLPKKIHEESDWTVCNRKSQKGKGRWWGYVVTGSTPCRVAWNLVWRKPDQDSSPLELQGMRGKNSKDLGYVFNSGDREKWSGNRNYSSSKHHDSLVVKTEIK